MRDIRNSKQQYHLKVTGHPFWRFVENQNQSDFHQIFKAKYGKVVKLTNNKIM